MARTRNLVVGCDGTWNEPEQLDNGRSAPTNVVKFLNALKKNSGQQRVHYEEGVGGRKWETLRGGIYGYGLDKRIQGAYRFLFNRFSDTDWDRDRNKVFLLGFSRGAYTARRISGLIAHSGIPAKKKDIELGFELYKSRDVASAEELKTDGRFFDVSVEMVGVWDTVKATNDPDYHDQSLSPNVVAGYHAIAIDEQRRNFAVLKWKNDARATQVWFAGCHSDVGGGFAPQGLADNALEWMIYRGLNHGLDFKANYVKQNVKPDPAGTLHDSFQGIWVPLGKKARTIPKTAFLHDSVKKRLEKVPEYRPKLPAQPNYWKAPG